MKYIIMLCILMVFIIIQAEELPLGALFIPGLDFDEVQYVKISEFLEKENIRFFILSDKYDTCVGSGSMKIVPFTSLDSMDLDIDFLIITGGSGILRLSGNEKMQAIIRKINEKDGIIATIGLSGLMLLESGIVEDEKISMQLNDRIYEKYKDEDIDFVAYNVIRSGNLITSHSDKYINWFIAGFKDGYNETFNTENK